MNDGLAHRLPARLQTIDDVFVAADHDRQPRLLGADIAAGNGRVDAVDVRGGGLCGDFDGQGRLAGRHVDQDVAGLATGQGAVLAEHDAPHVGGKTDDLKTTSLCSATALGDTAHVRSLVE